MSIDLTLYQQFVEKVTSNESNNFKDFEQRLKQLVIENPNINIPLLLTAAVGMPAEIGEFAELPKKIVFQGKPITEETVFHMKRELGDVIWYWINACRALNIDPNDVIRENVKKLESRYPGGTFDVEQSENRAQGDI